MNGDISKNQVNPIAQNLVPVQQAVSAIPNQSSAQNNPSTVQAAPLTQVPITPSVKQVAAPGPKKTGGNDSPWDDDDLDFQDGSPKSQPTEFGSLETPPVVEEDKPFQMPEGLEEKVGNQVPAAGFVTSNQLTDNSGLSAQAGPVSSPSAKAKIKFSPFSFLKKNKMKPTQIEPVMGQDQTIAPPLQNIPIVQAKPAVKGRSFHFKPNPALLFVSGLLGLSVIVVVLTENGLISIGAEKVYGSIGIDRFWGGLTSNSEIAFLRGAYGISKQSNYKANGFVKLTINRSVDSQVVSGLISMGHPASSKQDLAYGPSIKAIKTTSNSDDYYIIDNSGDSTSSTSGSSVTPTPTPSPSQSASTDNSTSTTNGTPTTEPTASSIDGSSDSRTSDSTSTSTEESLIEVNSNVKVKVNKDAIDSTFDISGPKGDDSVEVISSKNNLYVKNGQKISYSQGSSAMDWTNFVISALGDNKVQDKIFNISSDSGLVIDGQREKSEVVDGVRCYKYSLKKIEIGTAFSEIGINSKMVESISGEVWVGIKDKTMRKISLNFVMPLSSAVSNAAVELTFSDFGQANEIDIPTNAAIAGESTAAGKNSIAGSSTPATSSTATLTSDEKRKSDIERLLLALKNYKTANGSYPVSNSLLKLNSESNIIKQALVPKYLAAMPAEPKASDGWYYAYKSNGTQCSISSRLEDQADPEGQWVGTTFLYLKYNQE